MAAITAVLFLSAIAPIAAQAQSRVPEAPAAIHKGLVYHQTSQRDLHLDLYLNAASQGSATPILVHFHGGGWMRGTPPKSWRSFKSFLKAGFSVATVEYRLGGEAPAPAAVQDARCAVKWLAKHADTYSIDPSRIVTMGTSSGGHLALMAGLLANGNSLDLEQCQDAPKVAGIVDFYGPTDLTVKHPRSGKRPKSFVRWTGSGEAGIAMAKAMSPLFLVQTESPPVFIVHGDSDPTIPYQMSLDLKVRLDNYDVPNQLIAVKGGKHGKFSQEEHAMIADKLIGFFRELDVLAKE
jgi:acetyl esterase/lipase